MEGVSTSRVESILTHGLASLLDHNGHNWTALDSIEGRVRPRAGFRCQRQTMCCHFMAVLPGNSQRLTRQTHRKEVADSGRLRSMSKLGYHQAGSCLGAWSSMSRVMTGPTRGTAFVGSGNIATDSAIRLGKCAADTLARKRHKALEELDRPVFGHQGMQQVPPWHRTLEDLTGRFREEAPRLRGAVTPGQQDYPWLETGRRLEYTLEWLLRGGRHPGLAEQRLSPRAIADET